MATNEIKKISTRAVVLTTGTGHDTTFLRELKTPLETFFKTEAAVSISAIEYSLSDTAEIVRGGNVILQLAPGEFSLDFAHTTGSIGQNENDDIEITLTNPDDYIILHLSKEAGYRIVEDYGDPEIEDEVIVDDEITTISVSTLVFEEEFYVSEQFTRIFNHIVIDFYQEEFRDFLYVNQDIFDDIGPFVLTKGIEESFMVDDTDIELDHHNRVLLKEIEDVYVLVEDEDIITEHERGLLIEDYLQKGYGNDNYFAEDYIAYGEFYTVDDLFSERITWPVEIDSEIESNIDIIDSFGTERFININVDFTVDDDPNIQLSDIINKTIDDDFDSLDEFERITRLTIESDDDVIVEDEYINSTIYQIDDIDIIEEVTPGLESEYLYITDDINAHDEIEPEEELRVSIFDDIDFDDELKEFEITLETNDDSFDTEDEFEETTIFVRSPFDDLNDPEESYFAEDYSAPGEFYVGHDNIIDWIRIPMNFGVSMTEEQMVFDSFSKEVSTGFFDDVDVVDDPTDDILDDNEFTTTIRFMEDIGVEDEFTRNIEFYVNISEEIDEFDDYITFPVIEEQYIDNIFVPYDELIKESTANIITETESEIWSENFVHSVIKGIKEDIVPGDEFNRVTNLTQVVYSNTEPEMVDDYVRFPVVVEEIIDDIFVIDDEDDVKRVLWSVVTDDLTIIDTISSKNIVFNIETDFDVHDESDTETLYNWNKFDDLADGLEPYFAEDYIAAGEYYVGTDVIEDSIEVDKPNRFLEEPDDIVGFNIEIGISLNKSLFDDVDVADDPTDDILDDNEFTTTIRFMEELESIDDFNNITVSSFNIGSDVIVVEEDLEIIKSRTLELDDDIDVTESIDSMVSLNLNDSGVIVDGLNTEIGFNIPEDTLTVEDDYIASRVESLEIDDTPVGVEGNMFLEEYFLPNEKYVIDGSVDDDLDLDIVPG